jgi:magnesium transporter
MNKIREKTAGVIHGHFGRKHHRPFRRKSPGEVPGTAIHTGVRQLEDVLMTVHDFDVDHFKSVNISKIEKSEPYLDDPSKTWIQVRGLHDIDKLRSVWDYFNLHPLVQEDIVSVSQRPKVEPYDDAVFMVLRVVTPQNSKQKAGTLKNEQVSIVLGKNFVLSFQESDDPVFEPILKRLNTPTTRLRRLGPDYLAYALIDTIVDHYFQALDVISETIEDVEEAIVRKPEQHHLQQIHLLRRDLILFRKSVWSLRDAINTLIRDDSPLISEQVKIYLRDVYDHVIQVIDNIETSREMVYSLYDMYMSGLSNRMNEVMKVLTVIATIFIPLTFIAGIYGMNFDPGASPWNMPELGWYYGYPLVLGLMTLITSIMLYYFRKRGWF